MKFKSVEPFDKVIIDDWRGNITVMISE